MFGKDLKLIILMLISIAVTYIIIIIVLQKTIPYPTKQQLKEAEKVATNYVDKNNTTKLIITSLTIKNEIFNHSIYIEGHSQDYQQRIFHITLDPIVSKTEKITTKSINKICTLNKKNKIKCKNIKY
ncbi:hypothetical protein P4283_28050 [Bacillus thuringiensis]|nr:hypothetical protein [Bacillus thuringiensis]